MVFRWTIHHVAYVKRLTLRSLDGCISVLPQLLELIPPDEAKMQQRCSKDSQTLGAKNTVLFECF